jgi:hypothetical protein
MMNEEGIPIIAAAVSPFRVIRRDKDDKWEADWDEVNNRSYDYVKLSRVSVFFDVGVNSDLYKPLLGIGFDGTLILPALPEFRDREVAAGLFNEILGRILLGGIYFEAVSSADVSRGFLYSTGHFQTFRSDSPTARFHEEIRTRHVGILQVPQLLNPPSLLRKEVYDAHKEGLDMANSIPNLSLPILLRGMTFFVNHEWSEAMINIWSSIEQVISFIWDERIVADSDKANKIVGRANFLKDHRSWSVSTRIELLHQRKLIDVETYKLLNRARKARNEFVHKAIAPSKASVQSGLEGLFRLISRIISNFRRTATLTALLKLYKSHDRLSSDLNETRKKLGKVEAWLPIPPIPGSDQWGDKPFETFDDICFKARANEE